MACFTEETGDASRTLRLFTEVATDRDRILGPDHPDTLNSRNSLACNNWKTGTLEAAYEEARDVLVIAEASLEPNSELLRAIRWNAAHFMMVLHELSGRPLPREFRELQEVRRGGSTGESST